MTYLECSCFPKAMAQPSQHWHVQSTDCQTEPIVGNKKAESKGVGMNCTLKDFDVNRVHVESMLNATVFQLIKLRHALHTPARAAGQSCGESVGALILKMRSLQCSRNKMGMGMNHPGFQAMMDDDDDFEQELLDEQESQTVPAAAARAAAAAAPAAAPRAPAPTPGHLMGMNPYNTGDDAAISRSSSLLRGIPRRRLTCALEKLNQEMDAGFVSEMSQKGLLILLWLFTRLRPSTKIAHLRPLLSNHKFLALICMVFSCK